MFEVSLQQLKPPKTPRVFELFKNIQQKAHEGMLV
jgi:hypothetical protein